MVTKVRDECRALICTEFLSQARMMISPPGLSSSSRVPAATGMIVSVCWGAAATSEPSRRESSMAIPCQDFAATA